MDTDFEEKVEGHVFVIPVGTVFYGYCEGVFGEDILDDDIPNPAKRVESVGVDWIVARYLDYREGTQPLMGKFSSRLQMEEIIRHAMIPQDAGQSGNSRESNQGHE